MWDGMYLEDQVWSSMLPEQLDQLSTKISWPSPSVACLIAFSGTIVLGAVLGHRIRCLHRRDLCLAALIPILASFLSEKQWFWRFFILACSAGVTIGVVIKRYLVSYLNRCYLFFAIATSLFAVLLAYIFIPYLILGDQLFFGFTCAILVTPLVHFGVRVSVDSMRFVRTAISKVTGLVGYLRRFAFGLLQDISALHWRIGADILGFAVTFVLSVAIWYYAFRYVYDERYPFIRHATQFLYKQTKSTIQVAYISQKWVFDAVWKLKLLVAAYRNCEFREYWNAISGLDWSSRMSKAY